MWLGAAILGLGWFLGWGFLAVTAPSLSRSGRLVCGLPTGLLLGSWLLLLAIWILGYGAGPWAAVGLMAAVGVGAGWKAGRSGSVGAPRASRPGAGALVASAGLLLSGGLLAGLFWTRMLEPRGEALWSGGSSWGDLGLHAALVSHFAVERAFDWEFPLFAGEGLSYPFLVDFLSGLLRRAGWSLHSALFVPGLLLAMSSVSLVYVLGRRLFQTAGAGALAVAVFFMNGSALGLLYFWRDWRGSGMELGEFLLAMEKQYAHLEEANLRFSNVICDTLLPQRGFLLVLPVFLVIALLLCETWERRDGPGAGRALGGAAVLTGLLPLAHGHTFLVALGLLVWLATAQSLLQRRLDLRWAGAAAAACALAAPQLAWQLAGRLGGEFSAWNFGWMTAPGEGVAVFWMRNLGLGLAFLIGGCWTALRRWDRRSFRFQLYAALMVLFGIANLYQFQPHDYDNLKLLLYSWLAVALLTGAVLDRWFRHSVPAFAGAALCLLLLTATGALSVLREAYARWPFAGAEEVALARRFDRAVPPDSRVLTSDQHNHWVPTLTGRPIVMGYRGWLWTHGIDYAPVERDVAAIYAGGPDSEELLRRHGVAYAVVGPSERQSFTVDERFFAERFPLALESESYRVYRVATPAVAKASASK